MRSALLFPSVLLLLSLACGYEPRCGADLRFDREMQRCVCDHEWDPDAGYCFVPDGGTDSCVPGAEICNGRDDDCDGDIDELAAAASCVPGADVTTATCSAGACAVTACRAGFGDCDRDFLNGCEVDLISDAAHCGTCMTTCSSSELCQAETCTTLPVHDWVRTIGGTEGTASVTSVARAGSAGGFAIAGSFRGTVRVGTTTLTARGGEDAFVAMVSGEGGVAWVQQIGGASLDLVHAITVDDADRVHVLGGFASDFIVAGETIRASDAGDLYLLTFTPLGALARHRIFGGPGSDEPVALAASPAGSVYIAFRLADAIVLDGIAVGPGSVTGLLRADGTLAWAADLPSVVVLFALAASEAGVFGVGSLAGTAVVDGVSLESDGDSDAFFAQWSPTGSIVWAGIDGGPLYDVSQHAAATGDALFAAGVSYEADGSTARAAIWAVDAGRAVRRVPVADVAVLTLTGIAVEDEVVYTSGGLTGELDTGAAISSSAGGVDVLLSAWTRDLEPLWGGAAGGVTNDWPGGILVHQGRAAVMGRFEGPARFGSESVDPTGTQDGFLWVTRVR